MKKQKKHWKPFEVFGYSENLKRPTTYAEFKEFLKNPKLLAKEEAKFGTLEWLFKKGMGLMDFWKYVDRVQKIINSPKKDMNKFYKLWEEQGRNPKKVLLYDEELMRDVTLEEWGLFQLNLKSYEKEYKKVAPAHRKRDRKITLAIVDFLEQVKGRTENVGMREGYYDGLWDVLDEHKVDLNDVTLKHINEAWKLYRRLHPPPAAKPIEDAKPLEKGKSRDKLFGHNVTAVIRAMGKEGFTAKMCRRALDALGAKASENTIKAQLRYAKIDFKPPAPLTASQIDTLWDKS